MNEKKTKKLEIITINCGFKESEKVFSKVDPKTILHAQDIIKHIKTQKESQYTTADFAMYRMENDEAILYLAQRKHNLIFQNIKDALSQLKSTGNYVPTQKGIDQVVNSTKTSKTLRVNLSELVLRGNGLERSELKIGIRGTKIGYNYEYNLGNHFYNHVEEFTVYNPLNESEKLLMERVYGKGKKFQNNIEKMSYVYPISDLTIQVLNPEYVKEHAKDKAISRMSSICGFYDNYFDATNKDIMGNLSFYRKPLT